MTKLQFAIFRVLLEGVRDEKKLEVLRKEMIARGEDPFTIALLPCSPKGEGYLPPGSK